MKSIRIRIIVLSTFALISLLLAIFKEYDDVQSNLKSAQTSLKIIQEINYLSKSIHSLQRERGLSATNLLKNNIKSKLQSQRETTDFRLKEMSKFIYLNDTKRLKSLDKELNVLRKEIDTGMVSWDTIKKSYSKQIMKLLDQVNILIGNLGYTKEITNKLNSISSLSYTRENLGVLRATIARYYQKGTLTSNELLDVIQRYFGFGSRYKSFQLYQNTSNLNKLKNRIEGDVFHSVKYQIESIIKKDSIITDSSTVQWWSEATLVIDTMLEIENALLTELQQYSKDIISQKESELFVYSLSAFTIFFIVFSVTYFTVTRILEALSILIKSLHKVQQTEDFGIRIKTKSNDEFSQLGFSINQLLDFTDRIIKQKDELASIDVLTGVMNRRSFMTLVNQEVSRSRRYKTPLSLIFCDIDKFKLINDEYGHNIGDEVLQVFAQSIKLHIRESDLFVRWGGEEFIILAVDTDKTNTAKLAENLRKTIMEIKVSSIEQITCSFGVAELKNDESFEQLCERADQAVYDAKNTGRNKVCISD